METFICPTCCLGPLPLGAWRFDPIIGAWRCTDCDTRIEPAMDCNAAATAGEGEMWPVDAGGEA